MRNASGVWVLWLAASLGASAQNSTVPNGDAANGNVLFTKIGCYQCHGYAGQGGRAGARIVPTPLAAQDLIRYVRRPAGEMPAYTEKVASDQDLRDIYAYLKSFPVQKSWKEIPLLTKTKERQ
ncbi:MAG: cytochrome c [Acidobacteriaceae bacterium]|nr:cytochrome c [Acidobacteriaceae bacterium]